MKGRLLSWVWARLWQSRHRLAAAVEPSGTDQSLEALAVRLLQRHGALSLPDLIDRLVDAAVQQEHRRAGGSLDVTLWGPAPYRQEAGAAVRRLIGRELVLEADGPWLLARLATTGADEGDGAGPPPTGGRPATAADWPPTSGHPPARRASRPLDAWTAGVTPRVCARSVYAA